MKKLLVILLLFFPVGCDINQETNLKCELSGWKQTWEFGTLVYTDKNYKETMYFNIDWRKKKLYRHKSGQKVDVKKENWKKYNVSQFDKDFINISQRNPRDTWGSNKDAMDININLTTLQISHSSVLVKLDINDKKPSTPDGQPIGGWHENLKGICEIIEKKF